MVRKERKRSTDWMVVLFLSCILVQDTVQCLGNTETEAGGYAYGYRKNSPKNQTDEIPDRFSEKKQKKNREIIKNNQKMEKEKQIKWQQ